MLTKKVLSQKNAERFLPVEEIGKEKYKKFVKERIEGESSIWDTIRKEKTPSFTNNNKTTSNKLKGETLQIREERKLMNRILVASRSRAEIDLSKIFGIYEFSVVPLSFLQLMGPDTTAKISQFSTTIERACTRGSRHTRRRRRV